MIELKCIGKCLLRYCLILTNCILRLHETSTMKTQKYYYYLIYARLSSLKQSLNNRGIGMDAIPKRLKSNGNKEKVREIEKQTEKNIKL